MLIAMALSMLMTMGMWDFSAGSVVYAGAIFGGNIALMTETGIVGVMIFSLITALLFTTLSGVLYNLLRVPSMVLSIGLMMIYEVIPRLIFEGGAAEIPMAWGTLSQSPWCFIIFGIMFTVFNIVYNYTIFGHNVRAIGANQSIAYNAGVNITKIKLQAYIFGGFFLGIAGALFIFTGIRIYPATSMSSITVIFDAMMGVFLAFVLSRYCGFSFGLLIGAFTMRLLGTGLVSYGLSSTVRAICSGLFLLIILCYSANQGRFTAWRERKRVAAEANMLYKANLD
jgi:ribose transport system permease protein